MADVYSIALGIVLLALAPIGAALLLGIDRKLTARMQNRIGPPIRQPFYDVAKLLSKKRQAINAGQISFAVAGLVLQLTALAVLAFGGDLLAVFFVSSAGSVCLVLGAFSAHSPFSHMGAQRELLQILAYEPVLFLVIVSIGYEDKSFLASDATSSLLLALPLSAAALFAVLIVKMQKSPYDIATAHTEIISGPHVEYSGPYLGLVEMSHWAEVAILFGIFTLFWYSPGWLGVAEKIALVLVVLFLVVLVDNATARLTRKRMVTFILAAGVLLVALNLIWVAYLAPAVGL